jgi:hypothetical protein
MPLVDIDLLVAGAGVSREVAAFLREAQRRVRYSQRYSRVPSFIPTDYGRAYYALRAVAATGLAPSKRFCEWGSGLGVIAGLAAMLGFESHGVEIEPDLVDDARKLARDFNLPVRYACGSYVPGETDAYAQLGVAAADFGVIFLYPWPHEGDKAAALFEHVAGSDGLFLTYHSGAEFRLRQKN